LSGTGAWVDFRSPTGGSDNCTSYCDHGGSLDFAAGEADAHARTGLELGIHPVAESVERHPPAPVLKHRVECRAGPPAVLYRDMGLASLVSLRNLR
jgi:hypothetical protein